MARIIKSNGEEISLLGRSLEAYQQAVGGYIEEIYLPDGRVMLVNEEGRLHGLPPNPEASGLAGQAIVGDVVVLTKEERREEEEG